MVTLLKKETYLDTIKNSVGVKLWQNLYAMVDGSKKNITQGGEISCAYFVSSILYLLKMIHDVHATVDGTVRDLENSGWKNVEKAEAGAVLIWEEAEFQDGLHRHIGFSWGGDQAISNSADQHVPVQHHWTFGEQKGSPMRKVIAIYTHPDLA